MYGALVPLVQCMEHWYHGAMDGLVVPLVQCMEHWYHWCNRWTSGTTGAMSGPVVPLVQCMVQWMSDGQTCNVLVGVNTKCTNHLHLHCAAIGGFESQQTSLNTPYSVTDRNDRTKCKFFQLVDNTNVERRNARNILTHIILCYTMHYCILYYAIRTLCTIFVYTKSNKLVYSSF